MASSNNMHYIKNIIFYFIILTINVVQETLSLRLTHIDVPSIVDVRDTVALSCNYSMANDKLHSVKWYKDDREFFRYTPTPQPITTFPVLGVTLVHRDECNDKFCRISLGYLNARSTGLYKCEVSGDAPTFPIDYNSKNMTVYALPRLDPIVSGLGHRYDIGDYVFANCTSDISYPPSTLSWYINDAKATPDQLFPQRESKMEMDGFVLYSRSLSLRFPIEKTRFTDSRIRLKCVAKIKGLNSTTRETTHIIFVPSLQRQREMSLNYRSNGYQQRINQHLLTTCIGFILTTSLGLLLINR